MVRTHSISRPPTRSYPTAPLSPRMGTEPVPTRVSCSSGWIASRGRGRCQRKHLWIANRRDGPQEIREEIECPGRLFLQRRGPIQENGERRFCGLTTCDQQKPLAVWAE